MIEGLSPGETQPPQRAESGQDIANEQYINAAEFARRLGNVIVNARGTNWDYIDRVNLSISRETELQAERAYWPREHPSYHLDLAHNLRNGRAPVHILDSFQDPTHIDGYKRHSYMISSLAAAPNNKFSHLVAASLGVPYENYARYAPRRLLRSQDERQYYLEDIGDKFDRSDLVAAFEDIRIFTVADDEFQFRLLAHNPSSLQYHARLQEVLTTAEAVEKVWQ